MIFKNKKSEHLFLLVLGALVSALIFILHGYSPGIEGGMDSYNHYLIAKYSWEHPQLFMDYWGKPIYNIIASPFTQTGITGSVVFNIICLLVSAVFAYKTAEQLQIKYAFLAFVITLLSPIFLANTISSLTEPLNAAILMLCLYFFSKKNYTAGALVSGFLPYARSEGFVIIIIIGFYLLFVIKEYKSLLFLLVGSVIFNFLGWIILDKPFWIITDNPYIKFQLSGENICGAGSLIHYLRWEHITFGHLISFLTALGATIILWQVLIKRDHTYHTKQLLFLILGVFVAYFAAHSFIWWKGMMGSCGLIRVMVVIAPLAAILATYGLSIILTKVNVKHHLWLILILIGNCIYTPIKYYSYQYPLEISNEQELFYEVYQWYKEQDYQDRVKVYMYPYFSVLADIDPWDRNEHEELYQTSLKYYDQGNLIFWDGHFGPNEARIPLAMLLDDKENFKLINHFAPKKPFKSLNGYDFEIYVFEKLSAKES